MRDHLMGWTGLQQFIADALPQASKPASALLMREAYSPAEYELRKALDNPEKWADNNKKQPVPEAIHTFDPDSLVSRLMTPGEQIEASKRVPSEPVLIVGGVYKVLYEHLADDFCLFQKWLGAGWTNGAMDVATAQCRDHPGPNLIKVRAVIRRVA